MTVLREVFLYITFTLSPSHTLHQIINRQNNLIIKRPPEPLTIQSPTTSKIADNTSSDKLGDGDEIAVFITDLDFQFMLPVHCSHEIDVVLGCRVSSKQLLAELAVFKRLSMPQLEESYAVPEQEIFAMFGVQSDRGLGLRRLIRI